MSIPGGFTKLANAIDERSGHLANIESLHARIHEGTLYTLDQVNVTLANNATLEFLVHPPAGVYTHMRVNGTGGGAIRLRINEDVTASNDGTPATPINRNRNSTNVAETAVFTTPTVSDYGTSLGDQVVGTTGGLFGFGLSGGSAPIFEEFILMPDTKYTFRVTNISGSAVPAGLEIQFYENG